VPPVWRQCSAVLLLQHVPLHAQDKILQSLGRGEAVTITNDGATILKSVYVDNPAAKVLVGRLAGRAWRLGSTIEYTHSPITQIQLPSGLKGNPSPCPPSAPEHSL
jgi:hypothetical protein